MHAKGAQIPSPASALLLKILSMRDPFGSLHATAIGKSMFTTYMVYRPMKGFTTFIIFVAMNIF